MSKSCPESGVHLRHPPAPLSQPDDSRDESEAHDEANALVPVTDPLRSVLRGRVKSVITVEAFTLGRSSAHVIFVADCSGSRRGREDTLGGKPGHVLQREAIAAACQEFDRLVPGRIDISVVAFDVKSVVRAERMPASEAAENLGYMNLAQDLFGSTSISAGLRGADRLVADGAKDSEDEPETRTGFRPGSTVLCILSDGGHNTGEDPLPIAEELKQKDLQIATVWYPGPYSFERKLKQNRALMEAMASTDLFFEASHVNELPSILRHAAVTITRTSLT